MKITRINFKTFSVFIGQKSIFRHYCIENVKDGIQIQVNNINNESVSNFSQFIWIWGSISGKVKEIEAQAK